MFPSKILFFSCLSFVVGVFVFSFFKFDFLYFFFLLPLSLLFAKNPKNVFFFLIFIFCFFLGCLKTERALLKFQKSAVLEFYGKEIEIVGRVIQEPKINQKYQDVIVKIEKSNEKKFDWEKILVRTKKELSLDFGDKINIYGKLEKPKEEGLFSFRGYLAKENIVGVFYFPKIEKLSTKNFKSWWENFQYKILVFKKGVKEKISATFPFPESSLLIAFLFGEESQIPKEILENLNFSGLRHIIAVSGQHITVLVSLTLFLFLALGFWRKHALLFSIMLAFFFLILTGFQASAVRAVLMGFIFILSQFFGRITSGLRILILVMTVMLFLNPLSLRFDLGFQLSFLAMLGILTLYEPFYNFLKFLPKIFQIREIASLTLSAQFFVLPLTLYHFGYFSLSSFLSNLLVCPFFPVLLFLLIFFSFSALISKTLSLLFVLPIFVLIYFMELVAKIFSVQGAFLSLKISLPTLIFFYLLLSFLAYRIQKSFELKWLK